LHGKCQCMSERQREREGRHLTTMITQYIITPRRAVMFFKLVYRDDEYIYFDHKMPKLTRVHRGGSID
jgi:hypothetical protein